MKVNVASELQILENKRKEIAAKIESIENEINDLRKQRPENKEETNRIKKSRTQETREIKKEEEELSPSIEQQRDQKSKIREEYIASLESKLSDLRSSQLSLSTRSRSLRTENARSFLLSLLLFLGALLLAHLCGAIDLQPVLREIVRSWVEAPARIAKLFEQPVDAGLGTTNSAIDQQQQVGGGGGDQTTSTTTFERGSMLY